MIGATELPYTRRERHTSTVSLLDAIEKRTQKTYRYGIGLVCFGATLNWLGFAQGNSYIDPLRYLGVACVISGSFCVCLAMCRWLGRPISMSGHLSSLEEDSLSGRSTGDVHIINVAVPIFLTPDDYRPTKPPDYEIVAREPPPPAYDEAIKLRADSLIEGQYEPPASCEPSLSHSTSSLLISQKLSKSLEENSTMESLPPPYYPSPSRSIHNFQPSNDDSASCDLSDHQQCNNSEVSSINLINATNCGATPHQYRLSPEQEHLLGLMMQGHNGGGVASSATDQQETSSLLTSSDAVIFSSNSIPHTNPNNPDNFHHVIDCNNLALASDDHVVA